MYVKSELRNSFWENQQLLNYDGYLYGYVKSYKNISYVRCMNEKNKRFEICDYNDYENRGKFECLRGTAYNEPTRNIKNART